MFFKTEIHSFGSADSGNWCDDYVHHFKCTTVGWRTHPSAGGCLRFFTGEQHSKELAQFVKFPAFLDVFGKGQSYFVVHVIYISEQTKQQASE